jgi:N-acetylglucosamine-6-phosphate deacetylase
VSRSVWLAGGGLVGLKGIVQAAIGWDAGRLLAPRRAPPAGVERIDVRGAFVAPGFIDLHAWGEPSVVGRDLAAGGTTAFLSTIGPCAPEELMARLQALRDAPPGAGAACEGAHLEGPFLNPRQAGALPARWMRPAVARELRQLEPLAAGIRLMTLAPELPGSEALIRWCRRRAIVPSLGHSEADASVAELAILAGASAATHVFNRMPPLHHRQPGLLGVALTDDRLAAMAILDGIHLHPMAFRLLYRSKGPDRIVLVTDAVRHAEALGAREVRGAFYRDDGVLAGSALTMMRAVQNAVAFAKMPLWEAVRMASLNPARLLGCAGTRGTLRAGSRADLVVFDERFRVLLTVVDGRPVYATGQIARSVNRLHHRSRISRSGRPPVRR